MPSFPRPVRPLVATLTIALVAAFPYRGPGVDPVMVAASGARLNIDTRSLPRSHT